MGDLSSAALDAGFTFLEKGCKVHGCAVFAVLSEKGKSRVWSGTACHSPLMSVESSLRHAVATASNWRTREVADEVLADRFYDWLVNYSFASSKIIAPSYEFARDKGFILSGELPSNELAAICTLGRQMWEHRRAVARMFEIVDAFPGIDPDLAFVIAFGVDPYTLNGYGFNNNHNIVAPNDFDYLRNFVNQTPVKLNSSYRENAEYLGIMEMWGSAGSSWKVGEIVPKLLALGEKPKRTAKVVIPNPFAPVAAAKTYEKDTITEAELRKIIPALMAEMPNSGKRKEPLRVAA